MKNVSTHGELLKIFNTNDNTNNIIDERIINYKKRGKSQKMNEYN